MDIEYPVVAYSLADRIAGAMSAYACGDALGLPWEQFPPAGASAAEIEALPAREGWERGATSDDTALTLLVAQHLADRSGAVDAREFLHCGRRHCVTAFCGRSGWAATPTRSRRSPVGCWVPGWPSRTFSPNCPGMRRFGCPTRRSSQRRPPRSRPGAHRRSHEVITESAEWSTTHATSLWLRLCEGCHTRSTLLSGGSDHRWIRRHSVRRAAHRRSRGASGPRTAPRAEAADGGHPMRSASSRPGRSRPPSTPALWWTTAGAAPDCRFGSSAWRHPARRWTVIHAELFWSCTWCLLRHYPTEAGWS